VLARGITRACGTVAEALARHQIAKDLPNRLDGLEIRALMDTSGWQDPDFAAVAVETPQKTSALVAGADGTVPRSDQRHPR
jgi:hypothetical protein